MGAWGGSTVTGFLLHLGLGELAGGGLLPTSCSGGEGTWDQRGSGFTQAPNSGAPTLEERAVGRIGSPTPTPRTSCWSANPPADVITCDARTPVWRFFK